MKTRWLFIAPLLMLTLSAGCSRSKPPAAASQAGQPATAASSAAADSEAAATPSPAPPPTPEARDSYGSPVEQADLAIPNGTPLHVRIDSAVDTRRNRAGDGFSATLSRPIEVKGRVVVPAGTVFAGHVTSSAPSGRFKGRAAIGLRLDSFRLNGHTYRVRTTSVDRVSAAHKKRNGLLIGGAAGLGAAIGAIAGGGKGALIGAGAGAGAGTAGAGLTGIRQVGIPAETPLRFTLRAAVKM